MDWKIQKISSLSCAVLHNLFLSIVVFWQVTMQDRYGEIHAPLRSALWPLAVPNLLFATIKVMMHLAEWLFWIVKPISIANVHYEYYIRSKCSFLIGMRASNKIPVMGVRGNILLAINEKKMEWKPLLRSINPLLFL